MYTVVSWIVLALAVVGPADGPQRSSPERSPKREVEFLMSEGLPFAEAMLREHGEFFPFGAVMSAEGKIRTLGAFDEREQPPAEEVLELLTNSLREGVAQEDYRAVAFFVNVRVPRPPDGELVNAVHVALEHRAGYCVDVFYPYAETSGRLELAPPFAGKREGTVFPCGEPQP